MMEKMEDILALLAHGPSEEDCVSNIRSNPGLALLGVDNMSELTLLHNIAVLGPNLSIPKARISALIGTGALASCIHIHPSPFSFDLSLEAPKWSEIKAAYFPEAVVALVALDSGAPKCKVKALVPLPPFLFEAITVATSLDRLALNLVVSKALQAFDRTSTGVKACEKARRVIYFLWTAINNQTINFTAASDLSPGGQL
jgi:hypothetical protein